jgi:UDP-3-O-[3-hydroxymyristoyl] glucosamine N-acyltransferase
MEITLGAVAALLNGELEGGSAETRVNGVGTIDAAGPAEISFLTNMKYARRLPDCRAAAVVVDRDAEVDSPVPLIRCDNAYLSFSRLIESFAPAIPLPDPGVHPTAVVEEGVELGEGVGIGPFVHLGRGVRLGDGVRVASGCFIGDETTIGAGCVLYPNVVVRERCVIGERVILYPGAVIGSDGFGYAPDGPRWRKIPQIGNVILEDDVEIGANSTIDRGALGATRIGRGTKIDNLVQIAHNVSLGENCIMAGQVGISGSCKLGDHVILMGQVGVAGHLTLGDNVIVGAKSGISKSIPAGETWLGLPARPTMTTKRIEASERALPEKLRELRKLSKRVEELERRLAELEG